MFTLAWINYIKSMLNNCDMSGKKTVGQKLKDQRITTSHSNLSSKSICSSYNLYNGVYNLESCFTKLGKNNRIFLTKLRANNNRLPIVIGR